MVFKIYFLRHGESEWNKANVFTGWADVDLSAQGMQEAVEAGKCMKEQGLKFDVVFTSVLRRAVKTAWKALMHSENFSMPIINTWRLNERHYGSLQGLNKTETAAKHGEDQVKIWRRSYDIPPPSIEISDSRHPANDPMYRHVPASALPGAESLALTVERVLPFWNDQIAPCVMAGKTVLISAHGNSLRALCKHLEKMSEKDVLELNIPTAVPLCYELDEKLNFVRKYYLMDADEVAKKIAAVENQGKAAAALTAELLAKQDSETSQAIIDANATNPAFLSLSDKLCTQIIQRDTEDGIKLGKGIQLAVDKGVLPADVAVEPTTQVSVTGKSADAVADEIIKALGDAPSKGCVLTLQGLSGTGKGTTVAKLKEKLPNSQTWSNGNVFRSLTLLAVTYTEQKSCTLQDALKPEALAEFCGMLEFDKFNGKFDVKIEGLGLKYFISDIEKTVLKESRIATNIPTVAEVTQGEVVNFVGGALLKMAAGGINVLVEGREQTLNHIRTPHRFELTLDDTSIIGKRQAALQVGALAFKTISQDSSASLEAVKSAINDAIAQLSS
eukprot:gnl/MRDRNA2_/MRDRNA2_94031_c0_seq1.p1 gnl/MRDRNA2_/MRDRNA2_94031_c0~~gnl/MRDRNA2_/MRDRNA2_94031_c0_seq1.p1  ORF type:complete len:558 (+),score=138.79 gnl/MRDRNA2_/MRDRNA2_94031_c0_seq1:65-1738(+)